MRRLRVGIIGAGPITERILIPLLSGFGGAPLDDDWKRAPMASQTRVASPILAALSAASREETATARVLAESARLAPVYDDWRVMLREVELDAVMCAAPPETAAQLLVTLASWRRATKAPRALWVCGPPAPTSSAAAQLLQMMQGREVSVWCAHPLRHDFAHRAALRLIERDHIGAVSSLDFRGAAAFPSRVLARENNAQSTSPRTSQREEETFAAAYETFACLLAMAGGVSISGVRLTAARRGEVVSVWLQLASGTLVSARFCAADSWNAPLPRLEICGSDGRFLVCEGGRRLWQHEPRMAARLVEPPASSPRFFGAGVAEDARAFWSQLPQLASTRGAFATPSEASRHSREHDLTTAIRALRLLEAVAVCARENCFITLERDGMLPPQNISSEESRAAEKRVFHEKTAPLLFAVPPKSARESGEETSPRREAAPGGGEYSPAVTTNLTLPW